MHARVLSPHGPLSPQPSSPPRGRNKKGLVISRAAAQGGPRSPHRNGPLSPKIRSPRPGSPSFCSPGSRAPKSILQRVFNGLLWLLIRQPRYIALMLLLYVGLSGLYTSFIADLPEHQVAMGVNTGMGLVGGGLLAWQHGSARSTVGTTYESPRIYERFAEAMDAAGGNVTFGNVATWQHPAPEEGWRPCIERPPGYPGPPEKTNGYIVVVANGGLNQQRSSICNAVAVARLLNATLVVPHFHFNPIWRDPSTFAEIFDVDHFIKSLERDVRIVKELPNDVLEGLGETAGGYKVKVPAWATASFYLKKVLPQLLEARVIRFSPFANRLSYDGIPPEIQRLRCRTNFEALRFAPTISAAARRLTQLMGGGPTWELAKDPYVAVHLRFEKDMVAFSNCVYDGGEDELKEMADFREFGWRGKFTKPGRKHINPGEVRRDGKCPLTPLEVGMMLRGMGFPKSTRLYMAAGQIYRGDRMMAPLRAMFPNLQTKSTLLLPEELSPFKVFVISQGGNFPQILVGHRRFLNRGHWKTIRPDKRHLADFRHEMELMRVHNDVKGADKRKVGASIYTVPQPECMCQEKEPPGSGPGVVQAAAETKGGDEDKDDEDMG
eukprot:jgi/Mesen1/3499/ME000197S02520